jgi:hypothetical protein
MRRVYPLRPCTDRYPLYDHSLAANIVLREEPDEEEEEEDDSDDEDDDDEGDNSGDGYSE